MSLPAAVQSGSRPLLRRVVPLMERYNQMSLRERGLIFGAVLVVTLAAWQALIMDPLAARATAAQTQLAAAQDRARGTDAAGEAVSQNPAVTAAAREQALRQRLDALEQQLDDASRGYVPPERMAEVLRQLLAGQRGLRLVALRNLPAEPLLEAPQPPAQAGAAPEPERGPFLHPVEIELEGDYASVVAYVHALEDLPLRLRWRELSIEARQYPQNRVRLEIATLSLSRDWMRI